MDASRGAGSPSAVGHGRRGVPTWLAGVVAATAIGYLALTLVLGALLPGYDLVRQTQSELGAVDVPLGWAMNAGFALLGGAVLGLARLLGAALVPSRWRTLLAIALIVAGTGFVVVALFPCDPGCVDATTVGRWHSRLSLPPAVGLPVAMMLFAPAAARGGPFGPAWRRASFGVGLLSLGGGPVVGLELVPEVDGLLQRLAMWPAVAWLVAVAWRLRRRDG